MAGYPLDEDLNVLKNLGGRDDFNLILKARGYGSFSEDYTDKVMGVVRDFFQELTIAENEEMYFMGKKTQPESI